MNLNDQQLDQVVGSLLEAWTTREVPADHCRFCNESLDEEPLPDRRFCDESCEADFEKVLEARIALGERDLEQRGYD